MTYPANEKAQFAGDMLNLISNALGDDYLAPALAAVPNDHRALPAALELTIQRLLTDRATAEAITTELRAERDRYRNDSTTLNTLAYRIHEALQPADQRGATTYEGNPLDDAQQLIAERERDREAIVRLTAAKDTAREDADMWQDVANTLRKDLETTANTQKPGNPHRLYRVFFHHARGPISGCASIDYEGPITPDRITQITQDAATEIGIPTHALVITGWAPYDQPQEQQ